MLHIIIPVIQGGYSETVMYCRILKVMAPVYFGFSRQNGPLLSVSHTFCLGSLHFQIFKTLFYGNYSLLDQADTFTTQC